VQTINRNPTRTQRSGSRGERTSSGAIDACPKGGRRKAKLVRTSTGTPEEVAACEASYTGQYLKRVLE